MTDHPDPYRIAVVAAGAFVPGADGPAAFWRNILNRVDAAREVPPGRWPLAPANVYQPGVPAPDKAYSLRGYFLDSIPTDPAYAHLDPVVHLLLAAGRAAWAGAVTKPLDRSRVGVMVGNIALPTERVSELSRQICEALFNGEELSPTVDPLNRFAVGLPAGILARALGLGGGSVTLDAACASSLYALKLACDELTAGRADAMLTGGLNRSDSLYTQMGFSQLRALSPSGRCSPLDAGADGLMVGEGAVIFVLKRLEDAEAQGDRVLGVIRGIGLSNDIGGGLLAPAQEGQLRAMRAAYRQAGWRPGDVDLIECHATGTPVGDAVELSSLRELWAGEPGRCALGAVKANVGHLLTGAGAAGLLKVLVAVEHATLPPAANFRAGATELGPFTVPTEPRPWERRDERTPRRAAVNAFGFGGINAHVLVEEAPQFFVSPRGERSEASAAGRARLAPLASRRNKPAPDIAVVGIASGVVDRIPDVTLRLDRFKVPPAELRDALPQQLLLLAVADDAVDDAGGLVDPPTTGAFVGLGLDINTTNFHFRWSQPPHLRGAAGPPLTANRVMGSLGSIAASRLARAFGLGGPSFTLCSEETSGGRALDLAVRALERGELTQAVVGAVDLTGDPRVRLLAPDVAAEGAAAVVLMRLDDAVAAGKRVYAVVDGVGVATDDAELARERAGGTAGVGIGGDNAGAATVLASVVKACAALHRSVLPAADGPRFWLHDAADGPRRATITGASTDGNRVHIVLAEHPTAVTDQAPDVGEAIFLLAAETPADLVRDLDGLRGQIDNKPVAGLARRWWQSPRSPSLPTRLGFVARTPDELRQQIDFTAERLRSAPDRPISNRDHTGPVAALRDRVFYSPAPFGPGGVAFVYPGSGNHYPGMGRRLAATFPAVLRRHQAENRLLRSQFRPDLFWDGDRLTPIPPDAALFGQVGVGSLVTDLLAEFGVRPATAIGNSLGESAALVSLRAWRDRDDLFDRIQRSPLFTTDLAGPCDAARAAWSLPAGEDVDWAAGVLAKPADEIRAVLPRFPRAYLLVINTPRECVIGGQRSAVEALAHHLGGRFHPLPTGTIAHCDVVRQVADAYRDLHRLPTTPPADVRFYSGATGRAYVPDLESAAAAILGHASDTLDLPRLIESAYADGARLFVEVGPGSSMSRIIGEVLGGRPHLARSACGGREDEVSTLLRLLAHLHAEGMPVDLGVLYGGEENAEKVTGPAVTVPVGRLPFEVGSGVGWVERVDGTETDSIACQSPSASEGLSLAGARALTSRAGGPPFKNTVPGFAAARVAAAEAHEAFLRFTATTYRQLADTFAFQTALLERVKSAPPQVAAKKQPWLDRAGCLAFAIGEVGPVLGPAFAAIDQFPTRVRLPDEPLMLVDRITELDAEPLSMSHGRLVTEHDVSESRWYLDNGRIPASIAIESGQADLFLSGYLGIDFQTRGLAVYRLLDAAVTFHRGLPGPGSTIRYDIKIERFFRQGDTFLFRFRFDGTVDGEPLLTMRDGTAGFFTAEELAAGKGVVLTEMEMRPRPGKRPVDWQPLAPHDGVESYDSDQLDALRRGDLAGCFGPPFSRLRLSDSLTLPAADKLRLIHRVPVLDPSGGRYGLGLVRGEADIHPDDWFLTCHFVDDQVMPGTLMYECCLHTLRVFLLRLGWVGEADECTFEPVPGVASRLRCRGQVTAATRTVAYEISVKELGYGPEPFAVADALMYADGKPIVDVRDITLRLAGSSRGLVEARWNDPVSPRGERSEASAAALASLPLASRRNEKTWPSVAFTREQVIEFATGQPSAAFGDRYRPFDRDRFIARLPAPPYSFLDRIVSTTAEPWTMKAGGTAVAEYDVPPDEWYFARQPAMPFTVLLEVALQACGWMSAYVGSALHSETDLHYRNLGGTAKQFAPVGPDAGTLVSRVTMTKVSKSAGMIIQHFDFEVTFANGRPVYRGNTYFGFFSAASLAQQVGIREAQPYRPTADEEVRGERFAYPTDRPFPDDLLRMVTDIDLYVPDGGPQGLGFIRGSKAVDPGEWFFKAHFHRDPVWPGSLGLEAFLQLLQVVAAKRWGLTAAARWQAIAPGVEHTWIYRGQVVPGDGRMAVEAVITKIDDDSRTVHADGFLLVDGRVIYQMADFALQFSEAGGL